MPATSLFLQEIIALKIGVMNKVGTTLLFTVMALSYFIELTTAAAHIQERLKISLSSLNKRAVSDSVAERDNGLFCSEEEVIRLFTNLETICQNFIFNANVEETDFDEAFSILCKQCGDDLYALLKCFDTSLIDFAAYDVLCATNNNNDTCYSLFEFTDDGIEAEDIISKCDDLKCSNECRDVLNDTFAEYGCCLYSLVAINTSMSTVNNIWSACGLEEPDICDPAFGESITLPEPTTEEPIEVTVETTKPPDTTLTPSNDITLSPKTDETPTGAGTTESSSPSVSQSVATATVDEKRGKAMGVMSLTLVYLLVITFCCFYAIY